MRPPPHPPRPGPSIPPAPGAPTFASAQAQNGRHLLPALPARREGGGGEGAGEGKRGAPLPPAAPAPRALPRAPLPPGPRPGAARGPPAGPRKAQRASRDPAPGRHFVSCFLERAWCGSGAETGPGAAARLHEVALPSRAPPQGAPGSCGGRRGSARRPGPRWGRRERALRARPAPPRGAVPAHVSARKKWEGLCVFVGRLAGAARRARPQRGRTLVAWLVCSRDLPPPAQRGRP